METWPGLLHGDNAGEHFPPQLYAEAGTAAGEAEFSPKKVADTFNDV